MIEVEDIVNFEGDIYEVEKVYEDRVKLFSSERVFSVYFDDIKLVCKRENRLDLKG